MTIGEAVHNLIEKIHMSDCIGCGQCTGVCRIAEHVDETFSPRTIIEGLNLGLDIDENMLVKCNLCEELEVGDIKIEKSKARCVATCRYKINFYAFIRGYRKQTQHKA